MKSSKPKLPPLLKRSELVAGKRYKTVTKDRRPLEGILEIMPVKEMIESVCVEHGNLGVKYSEQSKDFYEEEKPVMRRKGFVFLDDQGNEYTEGAIRYIEIVG